MKITDMRTNNHPYFGDLKEGDVFLWNGDICMKVDEAYSYHAHDVYNYINLKTGEHLDEIQELQRVIKLDAELIIRGNKEAEINLL